MSGRSEEKMEKNRTIRIAHSPDSDDAFMFWALATGRLSFPGYNLEHTLVDIETLNQKAKEGIYEITALSFHAYPYVKDTYKIMSCGASFGDRYGPLVVSREKIEDIRDIKIAVPGELTTALLALRLFHPKVSWEVVPFDQILDKVKNGEFAAGLIIHEGQLTCEGEGLHKILDLGRWWYEKSGLPLPLGCNGIRKGLGDELIKGLDSLLKESIEMGLREKEESIPYALRFAHGMERPLVEKFISMYVNERTLSYGDREKEAVTLLLSEGFKKGIIPFPVTPEFV